jgi:hypothetical protein
MQSASDFHDQIREAVFVVAKNVFHDPATLNARNHMLNAHTKT